MQSTTFNVIDVFNTLKKNFKQISLFVVFCVVVSTIIVFLVPQYYKSKAVIVAANPALADMARLFNNNIQGLYSNFGSGDDLDRILGIANLDTTFETLVDEFNLTQYYKLKDTSLSLRKRKAVLKLQDDIELQKNELTQLQIVVSTKDKNLSANIANRMVEIVQKRIENIWQTNYRISIEKINASVIDLENEVDSINSLLRNTEVTAQNALSLTNKREALLSQLKQYYTLANEFKLAMNNNATALYTIEKATPAAKHYKPKKLIVLLAVAIISFVFACLATLLLNQKKGYE